MVDHHPHPFYVLPVPLPFLLYQILRNQKTYTPRELHSPSAIFKEPSSLFPTLSLSIFSPDSSHFYLLSIKEELGIFTRSLRGIFPLLTTSSDFSSASLFFHYYQQYHTKFPESVGLSHHQTICRNIMSI